MHKWTPIATRRRKGYAPIWRPLDGAPMTIAEARAAFDEGRIFMAQRVRDEDFLDLVVKFAQRPQPPRGYFIPSRLPSHRTPAEAQARCRAQKGKPVGTLCGQVFTSINQASAAMGVACSSIRAAARGHQKTAGGFEWRFL